MLGIDTSTFIDLFKGRAPLENVFRKHSYALCTTRINYLEFMRGIDHSIKQHRQECSSFEELCQEIIIFELDEKTSKRSGEITQSFKKKGIHIGIMDSTVAAILLENGVKTILTKNKKHFDKIPGMKVITY